MQEKEKGRNDLFIFVSCRGIWAGFAWWSWGNLGREPP